ncbi:polysaccharide biosynthesis nucleotide sugar epimerase dehydratase [Komagataeibacter europaeus NBRC 3261]|uniref:Polysaccharide biosynthesis nucleotide sugar epimerase dehydratase n=2 Tax=Komagataeibacter europaeus TaxID=33995 RepID=A0A0D6PVZ4_KOMEU|nr:polysaccharide biosynthesis nucleotide sugar epimerase dehydratase [Komagataeibacter europaeus NBRC 3261]
MVTQSSDSGGMAECLRKIRTLAVNSALDTVMGGLAAIVATGLSACRDTAWPWWGLPALGMAAIGVAGWPFRVFQQHWRFAGRSDFWRLAGACVLAGMVVAGVLGLSGVMRAAAFGVAYAMVAFVIMAGARAGYQFWRSCRDGRDRGGRRRVILLGDGEDASRFLSLMPDMGGLVVGMVVEGRQRRPGRRLRGVPVLGQVADLPCILSAFRAEDELLLVVADPRFRGERLSAVLRMAQETGTQVRCMPDLSGIAGGGVAPLHPVRLSDLLNRPAVAPDGQGIADMLRGRRVLITGAGGSIGSELARQIAGHAPDQLVLVDIGEFPLWQVDIDLAEKAPDITRHLVLADIRDAGRMERVFARFRPELVFHAAALKHVPMVEENPCEGLLTNVTGTRIVADTAARHGVRAMVLISTDKAVNPASVMGASKRIAEMYCQALDVKARNRDDGHAMQCVTVRFGNVMGSTGSVIPLFRHQLECGGPLTVTDPRMTRYFMTVSEAVGLVLQASARGTGRQADGMAVRLRSGGVFVLDMGTPVRIVDLARQMIVLAGLRPDRDVQIRFTGLRPGEKLAEDLFYKQEILQPTDCPGLRMATPRTVDLAQVANIMDALTLACRDGDGARALDLVRRLVPEFAHNPHGVATPDTAGQIDVERNAS